VAFVKSLKESISTRVLSIEASEPVAKAYHLMKQVGCRHLPVLEQGRLVGMISDRDVQRALNSNVRDIFSMPVVELSLEPNALVREFMSSPIVTVPADKDLLSATKMMIEQKIGALVIVEDQKIVGIMTRHDLLVVLADVLEHPHSTIVDRLESLAYNSGVGEIFKALSNSGI
jgi:acetoin utilization protein AcuB